MKPHILYLFGAGASRHSLPLINGIHQGLMDFRAKLENYKPLYRMKIKSEYQIYIESYEQLLSDIDWLYPKIEKITIDTLAKKLVTQKSHTSSVQLEKLKLILSLYFSFLEYTRAPDYRYDAFIAALINHNTQKFPDHVKILSWNYDIQMELAYSEYIGINSFHEVQDRLNVFPRNYEKHLHNGFGLHKLNGCAAFSDPQINYSLKPFEEDLSIMIEEKALDNVINFYLWSTKKKLCFSAIKFAWEEDTISKNRLNNAIEYCGNCRTAVIVGYSFPLFNREVDRQLFQNMKLAKIYFQIPEDRVEEVILNYKGIDDSSLIELIPRTDTYNFLTPPEL